MSIKFSLTPQIRASHFLALTIPFDYDSDCEDCSLDSEMSVTCIAGRFKINSRPKIILRSQLPECFNTLLPATLFDSEEKFRYCVLKIGMASSLCWLTRKDGSTIQRSMHSVPYLLTAIIVQVMNMVSLAYCTVHDIFIECSNYPLDKSILNELMSEIQHNPFLVANGDRVATSVAQISCLSDIPLDIMEQIEAYNICTDQLIDEIVSSSGPHIQSSAVPFTKFNDNKPKHKDRRRKAKSPCSSLSVAPERPQLASSEASLIHGLLR